MAFSASPIYSVIPSGFSRVSLGLIGGPLYGTGYANNEFYVIHLGIVGP